MLPTAQSAEQALIDTARKAASAATGAATHTPHAPHVRTPPTPGVPPPGTAEHCTASPPHRAARGHRRGLPQHRLDTPQAATRVPLLLPLPLPPPRPPALVPSETPWGPAAARHPPPPPPTLPRPTTAPLAVVSPPPLPACTVDRQGVEGEYTHEQEHQPPAHSLPLLRKANRKRGCHAHDRQNPLHPPPPQPASTCRDVVCSADRRSLRPAETAERGGGEAWRAALPRPSSHVGGGWRCRSPPPPPPRPDDDLTGWEEGGSAVTPCPCAAQRAAARPGSPAGRVAPGGRAAGSRVPISIPRMHPRGEG